MDVTAVLLDILIVLVAAKLAAEIAERINVPAVVGEIVAGIIIGPSVLSLVGGDETLTVLGELGVILLLLGVGLEMDIGELREVGRASMSVAVIGVVIPMVTGFAVVSALGHDGNQSLFIGAALAATSVGITARVFSDLRALATVEARTVLGAAVADDVLGLVILTVVVRLVSEGTVSILDVAVILAVAIGFLVVTAGLGGKFAPGLFQFLDRNSRSAGTLVALALAFTLALAELADAAQLAPIVGAFVAGLALSRSPVKPRIERELAPVGHLFIPVFFLEIGISTDVGAFTKPSVLGIAGALLVVAVIGKLIAGLGVFGAPGDKWLIGFGMIPRGEVGLIFATIGLNEGIIGGDLYAALLLVVLITTLMTPPMLRWRIGKIRAGDTAQPETPDAQPVDGWLTLTDGVVELQAEAPSPLALELALEASLAVAHGARPGNQLLEWLSRWSTTPLQWTTRSTQLLFESLQRGDARAWRFLETTGVLERALPELAAAVDRRRADPFLTDPGQVHQFDLVDRVRDVWSSDHDAAQVHAQLQHPEWLLLAALILETAGADSSPVELARRISHRLDLGAVAETEIALLVGNPDLMRAAATKVDGLLEESVIPIATHLETAEHARALFLLTLARDSLPSWDRERLRGLLALVLDLIEHDVADRESRNLIERRRAEAIRIAGADKHVTERIEHAPRAYLITQEAEDIARQARLVEPMPKRHEVRVSVKGVDDTTWRVEVAARDREGLLAKISGVIADQGLDILNAAVATWGDGAALDSFLVRRAELYPARLEPHELAQLPPPDAVEIQVAILRALESGFETLANPHAELRFDDAASPWYTICEVRSPDRRGLLHSLAAAIASAGISVHSARLVTIAGTAVDRFELTDRNGNKLDADDKDRVLESIRRGVSAKRPRRLLRR